MTLWAAPEGTAGGLYTPGVFEKIIKKIPCSNGRFPAACRAASLRPAAGRTRGFVHFFARSAASPYTANSPAEPVAYDDHDDTMAYDNHDNSSICRRTASESVEWIHHKFRVNDADPGPSRPTQIQVELEVRVKFNLTEFISHCLGLGITESWSRSR